MNVWIYTNIWVKGIPDDLVVWSIGRNKAKRCLDFQSLGLDLLFPNKKKL
jgi:hypothetical protein